MGEKRDNIYIYLWKDLNTVYIGRTVNPKSRHWAHKHRENETTYKFCVKYGVEHPKMVIIENNLTPQEGVEREKYWIKQYKDKNEHIVLNKSNGGELGLLSGLTDEEYKKQKEESLKNRIIYLKEYKKSHKKEISEKAKEYRKNNQDKIKEYRQKNKEKISLAQKKYTKEHKEEIALYQKNYLEKNKVKLSDYKKTYYDAHKEEIALKNKEYREAHKEEIKLKKKAYREAHKEEIALKDKKYRENNKEKLYESHKNYVKKNKEKIGDYKKQWYEKKKTKFIESTTVASITNHR